MKPRPWFFCRDFPFAHRRGCSACLFRELRRIALRPHTDGEDSLLADKVWEEAKDLANNSDPNDYAPSNEGDWE